MHFFAIDHFQVQTWISVGFAPSEPSRLSICHVRLAFHLIPYNVCLPERPCPCVHCLTTHPSEHFDSLFRLWYLTFSHVVLLFPYHSPCSSPKLCAFIDFRLNQHFWGNCFSTPWHASHSPAYVCRWVVVCGRALLEPTRFCRDCCHFYFSLGKISFEILVDNLGEKDRFSAQSRFVSVERSRLSACPANSLVCLNTEKGFTRLINHNQKRLLF